MNLRVQHVEFNINNSTQLTYDLISLYFPIETKQYTFGFKQTLLYFQPGRFYWKIYFPFSSYTLGNINNVYLPWKMYSWTLLSAVFKWRCRLSKLIVLDILWQKVLWFSLCLLCNTHSPSFPLTVFRGNSKKTCKKQIKSYTNSTIIEKNSFIKLDVATRTCPWFWLTG